MKLSHYNGGLYSKMKIAITFNFDESISIKEKCREIAKEDNLVIDKKAGILFNNSSLEIVAGTIDQLICSISIFPKDPQFVDIMLFTHTTFMKSEDLFFKMARIFKDPSFLESSESDDVIKIRSLNFIKKWISCKDIKLTLSIKQEIDQFFDYLVNTEEVRSQEVLNNALLLRKQKNAEVGDFPPSLLGDIGVIYHKIAFLAIDPEELSRQISLLFHELYQKVKIQDVIAIYKGKHSASIESLEIFSERLKNWAITEILNPKYSQKKIKSSFKFYCRN